MWGTGSVSRPVVWVSMIPWNDEAAERLVQRIREATRSLPRRFSGEIQFQPRSDSRWGRASLLAPDGVPLPCLYTADAMFSAEDGDAVEVTGHWSFLWGGYGPSLALIVDEMQLVGPGPSAVRVLRAELEESGAFAKRLPLPGAPSRIAVVSSRTSDGRGDLLTRLASNRAISTTLFDVDLRSRAAVAKGIAQAASDPEAFDLVAIVRGGGLQGSDLAVWSSSEVGSAIADRTVPVIPGIGHSADRTLADDLADKSFITPTEAADWVLRQQALQVAEHEAQEQEMREGALRRARLFAWIVAFAAVAVAVAVFVRR